MEMEMDDDDNELFSDDLGLNNLFCNTIKTQKYAVTIKYVNSMLARRPPLSVINLHQNDNIAYKNATKYSSPEVLTLLLNHVNPTNEVIKDIIDDLVIMPIYEVTIHRTYHSDIPIKLGLLLGRVKNINDTEKLNNENDLFLSILSSLNLQLIRIAITQKLLISKDTILYFGRNYIEKQQRGSRKQRCYEIFLLLLQNFVPTEQTKIDFTLINEFRDIKLNIMIIAYVCPTAIYTIKSLTHKFINLQQQARLANTLKYYLLFSETIPISAAQAMIMHNFSFKQWILATFTLKLLST